MADSKPKASIPAWQRAQAPQEPGKQDPSDTVEQRHVKSLQGAEAVEWPSAEAEVVEKSAEAQAPEEPTPAQQLEKAKIFLQDPDVKAAPEEKKRQFLESKGIPSDMIDQALSHAAQSAIGASEFADFQKSQQSVPKAQPPPTSRTSDAAAAPPIITYPEFLVEAHKPPPIITAERLLNTTYVLAGISTLIYAASRHLVAPMSADLHDARHDFFTHSQSKFDEMHERLSKTASKMPTMLNQIEGESQEQTTADDEEVSIDSDPTELFHRDIGVQTSPLPSPSITAANSLSTDAAEAEAKATDPLSQDISHLERLTTHLNDLTSSSDRVHTASREYVAKSEDLHHYIDGLRYQNVDSYKNLWAPSYLNGSKGDEEQNKGKDGIEELKKSIRSVKGTMLSARRFPAARGR